MLVKYCKICVAKYYLWLLSALLKTLYIYIMHQRISFGCLFDAQRESGNFLCFLVDSIQKFSHKKVYRRCCCCWRKTSYGK